MPSAITPDSCLGELALEVPAAAGTFEKLGMDFCCGGRRTLAAACASKSLDVNEVIAALQPAAGAAPAPDAHWRTAPLPEVIEHIVDRHHGYVRTETPRLQTWLDKVVAAHGARHAELARLRAVFTRMSGELAQHMAKEEMILFPAMRHLEAGADAGLAHPVRRMMTEHEDAGRDLAEMRELSGGYQPPASACTTWRVLYQGLEAFEADLHRHVHLENNVLFPRALETEANV